MHMMSHALLYYPTILAMHPIGNDLNNPSLVLLLNCKLEFHSVVARREAMEETMWKVRWHQDLYSAHYPGCLFLPYCFLIILHCHLFLFLRLVIFIIHAQIIFKFLYLLCGIFYRGNKFTDLLQLALDICCKPERANWIRNELETKTESISTNCVSFIPCELSLCITHTYPILFEEVPCSRKCVTDVVEKMWSLWARLPTIRHITAWCTDNSCSHSCLACCLFYD